MEKRTDLAIAFVVALALHGAAAVWLDSFPGVTCDPERNAAPAFVKGKSCVSLKELPVPVPGDTEPALPRTAVIVPEREAEADLSEGDAAAAEDEGTVELESFAEGGKGERDSDTADKGVMAAIDLSATALRPKYPLASRLRGEEGRVTVHAVVGGRGLAETVEVSRSSGFPALDREAMNAVRSAHFFTAGGRPATGGEVQVVFRFKLVE